MTDLLLSVTVALAGLGGAVILGLALAALVRRRSWPYLLVTLALATLLARAVLGALTMWAGLETTTHHLLEHGLDVLMSALVVAAVLVARRAAAPTGVSGDD